MSIYTIFYSWQSDLPNATNRGFIEKALERAAKSIRDDQSVRVEPVVDRDTAGVGGSPDIAQTIFDKIDQSRVFVCDVSILNREAKRPAPNPNVLIELGYARNALGFGRIIMVMNTAFGAREQLPFDLRNRRLEMYCMPKETAERAPERRNLEAKLERALRTILEGIEQDLPETPSRKVSFLAWNEKYISAEGGGGGRVFANLDEINESAMFDLFELGENQIRLRAQHGDYVCAEGGGGDVIHANRLTPSKFETFLLCRKEDDRVVLRTSHRGLYVIVEDDAGEVVSARGNLPGDKAVFRMIVHTQTEGE